MYTFGVKSRHSSEPCITAVLHLWVWMDFWYSESFFNSRRISRQSVNITNCLHLYSQWPSLSLALFEPLYSNGLTFRVRLVKFNVTSPHAQTVISPASSKPFSPMFPHIQLTDAKPPSALNRCNFGIRCTFWVTVRHAVTWEIPVCSLACRLPTLAPVQFYGTVMHWRYGEHAGQETSRCLVVARSTIHPEHHLTEQIDLKLNIIIGMLPL